MKKWQQAVLVSGLALGMAACGTEWKDMDKYVVTDKADNKIVYRGLGADTTARVLRFYPDDGHTMNLYNSLLPGDTIAGTGLVGYCLDAYERTGHGYLPAVRFVNGKYLSQFLMERRGIMNRDSIIVDMRGRGK